MSRLHPKHKSRANSLWLKVVIFLFLILAIVIYFALSGLLNKLPPIQYSIDSLTPPPSSGVYEPPLATYVIAEEALLHPSTDPESEVIVQLVKDTPVLLLAFEGDWVKAQSSTVEKVSGWALRVAFAMNEPKPAPAVTDSTPTHTPSPTLVATMQMTPPLTVTLSVTLPIAATPMLTQTDQLTVALSTAVPTPPTLIPPLEPSPTPPILANAVVQASTLKLRSGPDEGYADLGGIGQNTELKVTGKTEDCRWLYVITADGVQGWVPAEAVTLNIDCTQIPAAPLPTGTPSPQGPSDSSQSSNSSSSTQSEAKADLVVTAFAVHNIAENTITFDYAIANQGTTPVTITTQSQSLGIAIQVFLSDSQGNELFRGQTLYLPALNGLAPGQSYSSSYPGLFPSTRRFNPNGTLHLTLVVDAENVVNEVNESNNRVISTPLPITPTPSPQPTGTPIPTATLTYTPLPTNTPMPTMTSAPTLIPATLPTGTATPVPMPTSTATYIPTITPTSLIVDTPELPLTSTSIPTMTPTAIPATSTVTPTKTPILLPTVIPSVAPILLNPGFECTTGYYTQTNNIGEEIFIPNHWLVAISNGAPKIYSSRILFGISCDGSARVERIEGIDSLVVRAQDMETPPAPGKPFDVAFYQPVSVTVGGAYSLSGWLLSLCGGSATPSDCPADYYIAKMLGIDPTGGTDPNAESVIWTENRRNFFEDGKRVGWQQISVSAIAEASTITIFARIKSPFRWHGNHAFIDSLSLVRAPVVSLNAPAIITGTIVALQWNGMQSADIEAIPGGTYQLLIDVQYRHQTANDWVDILTGYVGSGSTTIDVACTETNYEFRIRARAEQPSLPAPAGAWPNHRYLGIWDKPILVTHASCQ